jgi:hypothetical protein
MSAYIDRRKKKYQFLIPDLVTFLSRIVLKTAVATVQTGPITELIS